MSESSVSGADTRTLARTRSGSASWFPFVYRHVKEHVVPPALRAPRVAVHMKNNRFHDTRYLSRALRSSASRVRSSRMLRAGTQRLRLPARSPAALTRPVGKLVAASQQSGAFVADERSWGSCAGLSPHRESILIIPR